MRSRTISVLNRLGLRLRSPGTQAPKEAEPGAMPGDEGISCLGETQPIGEGQRVNVHTPPITCTIS